MVAILPQRMDGHEYTERPRWNAAASSFGSHSNEQSVLNWHGIEGAYNTPCQRQRTQPGLILPRFGAICLARHTLGQNPGKFQNSDTS